MEISALEVALTNTSPMLSRYSNIFKILGFLKLGSISSGGDLDVSKIMLIQHWSYFY
jgi:hypothetical protein